MKEFNGYFKKGGVLRFASGGTGPGLNNALNAQSFLPTGHIASNLNLNSDNIFSIYSKPLGKIVDSYGDSLFINSNDYNKDTSIRYLFDIRKDLLNLDIPKEYTKDIKSLTDYFKDYIDTHTNGYKKVTKLPDGRDSVAYFDSNKKYLRREGPRPENLNDGEIIRNVSTKMANINAHALAELWFLYNGISYAKRGMKIKKYSTGGISPESIAWMNEQNGAAKYYRNQTNAGNRVAPFAPFYYRMRYGYDNNKGLYLPDGEAFAIVKNTHNGKPIVYSEIMQDGDRLVDYRNDPEKAYEVAIKTKNYLTVPSEQVADEFISDYRNHTD